MSEGAGRKTAAIMPVRQGPKSRAAVGLAAAAVLALLVVHAITGNPSEPFFNNDETRHVMTGVFFRDLLTDMPIKNPRDYIIRYYMQYPALGFPLWPPLFHATEGVLMLGLGTSIAVAKRGRTWIFRRAATYRAAALALVLVVPFYALTASELGWVYGKLLGARSSGGGATPMTLESLWFYPSRIPGQIGWILLIPCLIGLARALAPSQRSRALPYLAITAVTYVMLTPMGIRESRYALSWIPALAVFGAEGTLALCERLRRPGLFPALGILLVAGTATESLAVPAPYLQGYEAAARYVHARTRTAWCCLFDGGLNGNFIYQFRRNDPDRKLWVLRGDKLLYSVVLDPELGQPSIEKSDADMLATIFKYDPEYLVVEEPMTFGKIPAADRLRVLLDAHPERFSLETTLPVETNEKHFKGVHLKIYRNIKRNPTPASELEIEMLTLRRSIRTGAPRVEPDSTGDTPGGP